MMPELIQDQQNELSPELEQMKIELLDELRVELMAMHLGDDYLVKEEEAARLLDVHPKTLYKERRAGNIQYGMIGSSPRYSLGALRIYMRNMMEAG